jgi:hypothetical protein
LRTELRYGMKNNKGTLFTTSFITAPSYEKKLEHDARTV